MKNFVMGIVVGIAVATVGVTGLAKLADSAVVKVKTVVQGVQ